MHHQVLGSGMLCPLHGQFILGCRRFSAQQDAECGARAQAHALMQIRAMVKSFLTGSNLNSALSQARTHRSHLKSTFPISTQIFLITLPPALQIHNSTRKMQLQQPTCRVELTNASASHKCGQPDFVR
jgi:hypothetical protein